MYSASRGIHYTAPPGPKDETGDERADEAESESATASDRSADETPATRVSDEGRRSTTETGLAADD